MRQYLSSQATVRRNLALSALLAVFAWWGGAVAQEIVHFPSLEDNGAGQNSTTLDGYLWRLPGGERRPAILARYLGN